MTAVGRDGTLPLSMSTAAAESHFWGKRCKCCDGCTTHISTGARHGVLGRNPGSWQALWQIHDRFGPVGGGRCNFGLLDKDERRLFGRCSVGKPWRSRVPGSEQATCSHRSLAGQHGQQKWGSRPFRGCGGGTRWRVASTSLQHATSSWDECLLLPFHYYEVCECESPNCPGQSHKSISSSPRYLRLFLRVRLLTC